MWLAPITNRTREDVIIARNNPQSLQDLKGAQNNTDWNRLAINMYHLAEILENYGQKTTLRAKADWAKNNIPSNSDIEKVRDGLQTLRRFFYLVYTIKVLDWDNANLTCEEIDIRQRMSDEYYSSNPIPTLPYTHYEKINDIERIVSEIESIIQLSKYSYRVSGTFSASQISIFPKFIEPHVCDMTCLEFDLYDRTVNELDNENRTADEYYNRCFDPYAEMTVLDFNLLDRTVSVIDTENSTAESYYRREN